MQWLNQIIDELIVRHGDEEIIVSSGVSPSGTYHLGTLREVLTAETIAVELRRRGRKARHIHIVDDLDVFRKVPANVSDEWEKYLGRPLVDVPAPDGSSGSYADFFLHDLLVAAEKMNLSMEIFRAHEHYQAGDFAGVIETALENVGEIRQILETVSGRKLPDSWTPIQVIEDGYVKNRQFVSIDPSARQVTYKDKQGYDATADYSKGEITLSWRVDWPARWSMLSVDVEPFGRDHATKGGSYDTGVEIAKRVFRIEPPLPVPYNFVNRVGETKKMSKSAGNVITAAELLTILPPEIVRYFLLRFAPEKQLFFGEGNTLLNLFDDFAIMLSKTDKEPWEQQLAELCLYEIGQPTVSSVPFSHLVASYQAALKDPETTIDIIARSEHADTARDQREIILRELSYIDSWLNNWAPEELKFSLLGSVDFSQFSDVERQYFAILADKIATAPDDADGVWFHQAIYDIKDQLDLKPQELFSSLYRLLIGKTSGPRAGWFLSILPRDWLLARLRLDG